MLNGGFRHSAAHMPQRRPARLGQVEHVHQAVVLVAMHPCRMIERLVEDPHRLHVLIGRQVLVAKHLPILSVLWLAKSPGHRLTTATVQFS